MNLMSQGPMLGDQRLSMEFNGGPQVDGVALTLDGRRYAFLDAGSVEVRDVPPDGKFTVGGKEYRVEGSGNRFTLATDTPSTIVGAAFGSFPCDVAVTQEIDTVGPGQIVIGAAGPGANLDALRALARLTSKRPS